MVERAEAVAAGKRALKKDRFVRITDAAPAVDWDLVKRAQNLAGLKGYADAAVMPRSVGVVAGDTRGRGWLVGIITGAWVRGSLDLPVEGRRSRQSRSRWATSSGSCWWARARR